MALLNPTIMEPAIANARLALTTLILLAEQQNSSNLAAEKSIVLSALTFLNELQQSWEAQF